MNMSQTLTVNETISRIQELMDNGKGDAGRLNFILEFIKNNKPLYKSDHQYLEKKLQAQISAIIPDKEEKQDNTLDQVQQLIKSGIGDVGRLQFIYEVLLSGKKLYKSDQIYLESKLEEEKHQEEEQITIKHDENVISQLKTKLAICNDKILWLEAIIAKTKQKATELGKPQEVISKLRGTMPKGWKPTTDSKELSEIDKQIKSEEEKLEKQKN